MFAETELEDSGLSAFKQQTLQAWEPILTARTVIPTFFIVGLSFIPIGVFLYHLSQAVQEQTLEYTLCKSIQEPNTTCADLVRNKTCKCKLYFTLEEDYRKDVFLYYGLTNFYQNHRRYIRSGDDYQLSSYPQRLHMDCAPFRIYKSEESTTVLPIATCGGVANSQFNDTITLQYEANQTQTPVGLLNKKIAWPTDQNVQFFNPYGNTSTSGLFNDTSRSSFFNESIHQLDTEDLSPNLYQDEDFMVWMRTAALPTFRKLFRRIDHSENYFKNSLPKGNYSLIIGYNFPVKDFDGTKAIIISNTTFLGGKNLFLAIAYMVVGALSLLTGVFLLIVHVRYGKKVEDMLDLDMYTPYSG